MSVSLDRFGRGATVNDAVAAQLAAAKRRRIWSLVIVANALALVATIVGCLLMVKSQGVRAEVEEMRNEIGEYLTMMSLGGANEAVARHLPRLIGATAKWDRRFAERRESFRGLDLAIDQVQAMHRLGGNAERWRQDLEAVSPTQRGEVWQKSIKAQVAAEQKKWPNRTHEKNASEWFGDFGKELWYGLKLGFTWPVGIYNHMAEILKGGRAIDRLGVGDCLRYVLFPYRISSFTMLRLFGIVLSTTAIGYLCCWLGLKSRFGFLSYVGLVYFLYLLNIALFILYLEVVG